MLIPLGTDGELTFICTQRGRRMTFGLSSKIPSHHTLPMALIAHCGRNHEAKCRFVRADPGSPGMRRTRAKPGPSRRIHKSDAAFQCRSTVDLDTSTTECSPADRSQSSAGF